MQLICECGLYAGVYGMSTGQSFNQSSLFLSLCFIFFYICQTVKINNLREYWLPRITDKLIVIGSQFIHKIMLTISLGWHTLI